ncbi:MAG: phage/plasmid primase, P4 family [Peptoniphilaceae bacterium]
MKEAKYLKDKYENLPQYLKDKAKFCVWKQESGKGKVPYQANGKRAKANKVNTFTDFKNALDVVDKFDGLGIGIFNKISAIDIDNCIDVSGNYSDLAKDVMDIFKGSYIERSPSGKGIRVIFLIDGFSYDKRLYYINNQKLGLEVYVAGSTNKYVTITGNAINQGKILLANDKLQVLLDKYMQRPKTNTGITNEESSSFLSDSSVIEKATASATGNKFKALWKGDTSSYPSQSEADLALCSILAFWCGRDINQMDRLFQQSGLMRDKWHRVQSGSTYGQITLEKAIANTKETYSPMGKNSSASEDFMADKLMDLSKLEPFKNPRYYSNDIGNSNLFADFYKSIARYVPERKKWFVYDGKAWRSDTGNLKVMKLCKNLANKLMYYALSIKDENLRKTYIKSAGKWQERRTREIILRDAGDVYPLSMSEFDKDIYLLNCFNGTLNLQDGNFYPHKASDYITKIAGVNYDPNAVCNRWIDFVDEVMCGDKEKAEFFQKSLGYALTGDTRYESMFILFGATTRNGKGTSMETFLNICGDYGRTSRPETIGMKINSSSSAPSEDVARLAGSRFVNISEPDKKLVLSAALLKSLTGNDTINARFLHENSFDFRPQFKIFINTNHLPMVTDLTLITSGRVKIIPFERHFEEWEQDKNLKKLFSEEENLSGILNWVIEGYRKIQTDGFKVPATVRQATLDYHKENDKIGLFVEERLSKDANAEERTSALYFAYQNWCRDNGYYTENARNFKSSLASIGRIARKRPKAGGGMTTLLIGYKLNDDFADFLE